MLLEDDPLKGISSPLQYRYMKVLKVVLRFLGGWPGTELGEKKMAIEGRGYTFYNTVVLFICFVLGLIYLIGNMNRFTFYELGHMYVVLLMNFFTMTRALVFCISQGYWKCAVKFIKEIHLFHHKDTSAFSMQIHKRVHRMSHLFCVYFTCESVFGWLIFNIIPMYNNYSSGMYDLGRQGNLVNSTFEVTAYFWMPFNFETNLGGYIWYSAFVMYVSYIGRSLVCVLDLLLSLVIFHLWGHFKILINSLQSFPRPITQGMYSESEMVLVTVKLKNCIKYHRFIARFTNEMSEAFSLTLLVQLSYFQASGCVLLLECSQMNAQALVRYLTLTVLMFQQLTQVSLIFEIIGTVSGQLKDVVYGVPWECMDSRGRRIVLILLMNVQKPIHVKAGGLVNVGVTTMASIIKSSFSFFAFLKTVNH